VVQRFGIERVVEHYGSTEMPGDAVIQWFGRVGSCGYIPPSVVHSYAGVLIEYDVDQGRPRKRPGYKDDDTSGQGWALRCVNGQPGELVMCLPEGKYDGYVGEEQTQKKLYKDVFQRGDVWFATGDLLKYDADGYFYFVDRAGDSFRWKGENVATAEVADLISEFPGILEANVYGVTVPYYDGKAGMLSLTTKPKEQEAFDMTKFSAFVLDQLPHYARPLFIRLRQTENDKTSTFKFQKSVYMKQAFDLAQCQPDQLYVWLKQGDRGNYVALTQDVSDQIQQGKLRF
jgi:fatty-acyl-CoA synthase